MCISPEGLLIFVLFNPFLLLGVAVWLGYQLWRWDEKERAKAQIMKKSLRRKATGGMSSGRGAATTEPRGSTRAH